MNVGEALIKYNVRAPSVTGDEHFERAYRVQMNTLEQMALFPSIFVALRHNGYLIHPPRHDPHRLAAANASS